MSEQTTYNIIKEHPVLNKVLNELIVNQFQTDYQLAAPIEFDSEELRKACWLATMLALSEEEKDKFVAASFAKLLFLQNVKDEDLTKIAYVILSRTGNLAATRHLKTVFDEESNLYASRFGSLLDFELGSKRDSNRVDIESTNETFFVTDFQKSLWDGLHKYQYASISAPTSAGKSLFTQRFISSLLIQEPEFKVIYIVPTKALIAQVSDDFKKTFVQHQDIYIKTAYVENSNQSEDGEEEIIKKVIYCVTPERCLKLLQQGWENSFVPDLVFVDEIQNVETNDNRAVLLEYVLGEIRSMWSNSKILSAGPFMNNGAELFEKLFEIKAEDISTFLPPIYQLRLTIKISKSEPLSLFVHLRNNGVEEINLTQEIKINSRDSKKSILAPVLDQFGKNDGNIIYAGQANWCVSYATEFIKHLKNKLGGRPRKVHPEILDLIDFLKEEIHPNYYLIFCLYYKVGFHHGKLPETVRNEIEYLFKEGIIKYIFCTSTLLQGVNLPAPRMFIFAPKKGTNNDLSKFEFGNLIGRAGRIGDSLIGTVFCLEKEDNQWSTEYYQQEYGKSVVPTTEKSLGSKEPDDDFLHIIERTPRFLRHTGSEYTSYFLKQKYLDSPVKLDDYLITKKIPIERRDKITSILDQKFKDVSISHEVTRLNPSVDPLLQNILYERILKDGIENWVFIDDDNGNINFNKYLGKTEGRKLAYEKMPFYYQFENIFLRLDDIFAIWKEAYKSNSSVTSVKQMIFHASNWLTSTPFHILVEKEIEYSKSDNWESLDIESRIKETNKHIDTVAKVNSTIVTYLMVKYAKLLVDILQSILSDEEQEKYKKTISLPTMLELGTRKIDVILMISMGMPRSIAIKLSSRIPDDKKEKPIEWLADLKTTDVLKLRSFYLKFLWRNGYLPNLLNSEVEKIKKPSLRSPK